MVTSCTFNMNEIWYLQQKLNAQTHFKIETEVNWKKTYFDQFQKKLWAPKTHTHNSTNKDIAEPKKSFSGNRTKTHQAQHTLLADPQQL